MLEAIEFGTVNKTDELEDATIERKRLDTLDTENDKKKIAERRRRESANEKTKMVIATLGLENHAGFNHPLQI